MTYETLCGTSIVTANERVADETHLLTLSVPWMRAPEAGQFVHVRVPDAGEHLLSRPISVHDFVDGMLRLIVAKKGAGTERICARIQGDPLSLTGPLGHGFSLPSEAKRVLLVGGGIGCAPLYYATRVFPQNEYTACLGFRTVTQSYALDAFRTAARTLVATDDGTLGMHGNVTVPIASLFGGGEDFDIALICGPKIMMHAAYALLRVHSVACQLSFEERMGCGLGACLTCSCKIGKESMYKRVCTDGPVFAGEEAFPDD